MPSAPPQAAAAPRVRSGRPLDLLKALPHLAFVFNSAVHSPGPALYSASADTRAAADHILGCGPVQLKVDHMILPRIARALDVNTPLQYPRPAQLDAPFLRRWDAWIAALTATLRDGDGADHDATTAVVDEVVRLANAFLSTRFVPRSRKTQWLRHPHWPDLHVLDAVGVGLLTWTNAGADTGWSRLLATLGNGAITAQRRPNGGIHTKPYAYSQELCDVMSELLFTMHAHNLVYMVVTSGPAMAVFELKAEGLRVTPVVDGKRVRRGPNLLTLMVGLALTDVRAGSFVDLTSLGIETQMSEWRVQAPPPTPVAGPSTTTAMAAITTTTSFPSMSVVAPQAAIPPLPPLPMAPPPPPGLRTSASSPPKTPDRTYTTPIPSAPSSKTSRRFHPANPFEAPGTPSPSAPAFRLSQLSLSTPQQRHKKRRRARTSVSAPDLPHIPDLKFDPTNPLNLFGEAGAAYAAALAASGSGSASSPGQSIAHRPTASFPNLPADAEERTTASGPGNGTTSANPATPARTPHNRTPSSRSSTMSMPRMYRGFPGGEAYDVVRSPSPVGTDEERDPDGDVAMRPGPPEHLRSDEGRMATPSPPPEGYAAAGTTTPPRRSRETLAGVLGSPAVIGPRPSSRSLKRMREATPLPALAGWDIPRYDALTLTATASLAGADPSPLLAAAAVAPTHYRAKSEGEHADAAPLPLALTLTRKDFQGPRWRHYDADLPARTAATAGPARALPVTVKLFSAVFPPPEARTVPEWEEENAEEEGGEAALAEGYVGFFVAGSGESGDPRILALVQVDMARLALGDAHSARRA